MNGYSNFRRHEIGISQKAMSKIIGISSMTINRFEQNDTDFGGVSPEMVKQLKQKYDEVGKYFSRQNRESYMTYIRSYLDQSHIGLVEFSRMCKTGTDIYRRPNKKSYMLATADQILHIQEATGIMYDDVLGFGDGRRKKSNAPEPVDILEEPTEVSFEDVLQYIRSHATDVNGIEVGMVYSIAVNPDGKVSYYCEWDEITTEHHKKELTAVEFRKATKYIEYKGAKR